MQYGHFDDTNREYVITQPDTPLPWINYLGCEAYFGLISNTAGGYSFYRDARLRRITRYRYNNVPFDLGGRYIYVRDNESSEFWSPSWQPTRNQVEKYTCRHGMGYSIIGSEYKGIEARTRYFVPLDENLEIWQLTVTNHRQMPASLSIFSSIEFCLWDAQDDSTNFQRNFSIGQVEIEDGVIYHKTEYRERRDHFAYFACSAKLPDLIRSANRSWAPIAAGTNQPWSNAENPRTPSLTAGRPSDRIMSSSTCKPGESQQIIFVLGYHENPVDEKFDPPDSQTVNKKTVKPIIAKYLKLPNVDAAFDRLRAYWDELLGICQVETPDIHTNRMVNIWNAYQCMATFNMSRSASFYESGIGRGLGFRDSNQDLLGFVHMVPARARERILDLAATQLPTGGAYHQYQPLTKRGQQRRRRQLQRRSALADHWRVGLSQGNRRLEHPRRAGSIRQRAGLRAAALRAPAAQLPVHARPPWAAWSAADRPRRLERLPEPELLLGHAGPILPDHHEQRRQGRRVGLHRRTVRAGREKNWRRSPSTACHKDEAKRYRAEARRWTRPSSSTAGTASGSCAPTTISATRSDRTNAPKARSSSSRRASACWPASGLDDGTGREGAGFGAQAPGDPARHRAAAAGILALLPASRRDFLLPAGLQGERRHLLPQQSVGDDRRSHESAMATMRTTTTRASTPPRAKRSATCTAASPTCMRR